MNRTDTSEAQAALTGCLVTLVLSPFAALWKGYVLSVLWGWFVIPTFGLPRLSIPVAIGLTYLLSLMHPTNSSPTDKNKTATERTFESVLLMILTPGLALLFGWIVYGFTGGTR